MKKTLANTKCTVKLRKSDYREEWYLIIESYPVFKPGSQKSSRIVESLNRIITTPIWDKTRNARTATDGSITYKPKRDMNGVIMCKSAVDQESSIYADKIRGIKQREYDNKALFTDDEAAQAEQNEKSQCNFIEYFKHVANERHRNSSNSIIINWNRVYELLKIFAPNKSILLRQIDIKLIEEFKRFLLSVPQGGSKSGVVSQNTASTYFSIFKAGLKQAFIDGYLTIDWASKVKGIPE